MDGWGVNGVSPSARVHVRLLRPRIVCIHLCLLPLRVRSVIFFVSSSLPFFPSLSSSFAPFHPVHCHLAGFYPFPLPYMPFRKSILVVAFYLAYWFVVPGKLIFQTPNCRRTAECSCWLDVSIYCPHGPFLCTFLGLSSVFAFASTLSLCDFFFQIFQTFQSVHGTGQVTLLPVHRTSYPSRSGPTFLPLLPSSIFSTHSNPFKSGIL